MIFINNLYPFQTKISTLTSFLLRHFSKQFQGEHYIFLKIYRIEQRTSLKNHPNLFTNFFSFFIIHLGKISSVKKHISFINIMQTDNRLKQNRFTRSTLSDYKVDLSLLKLSRNIK